MASNGDRGWIWTAVGIIYGICLLMTGICANAAGHGTSIPLVIFGAPLTLGGGAPGGPLVVWPALGFAIDCLPRVSWGRIVLGILMATHYISAFFAIQPWIKAEQNWSRYSDSLGFSVYGPSVLLYLVGQIVIWWQCVSPGLRRDKTAR